MNSTALVLVIAASFIHATWNLLAKQIHGGASFVWTVATLTSICYAPLVIAWLLWQPMTFGWLQVIFLVGSALLHLIYFLVLQRGYQVGDLSVVYPLARGTGPTFSTLGAILLFGERPTIWALCGGAMIIAGVVIMATGGNAQTKKEPSNRSNYGKGVIFGTITGFCIALYTLWDKQAVSHTSAIPPLILDYASSLLRMFVLLPVAISKRAEVRQYATIHLWPVLAVALLNPLSFILVLTALTFSPVSYVAPAREISILIGVIFGARFLSEGQARLRLCASALMLIGIIILSLK